MAVIGIDLGTTNSLVTVWKDGKVQLVPNAFGEFLTPSVVSIADDGEVFVGKIAKEMLISRPDSTFAEFKRFMGTTKLFRVGAKEYRAEELSSFVLRRLKEDAERFLGEIVTEAIISVPAYFNDDRRCATRNAGLLAGLNVQRLINEPSAVALKHHHGNDEMEKFIVFDFGGGTLDVSLVDAFDNMIEIQAVAGDNNLGGKDFNDLIAEEFYKDNSLDKISLSEEIRGIITKEAEAVKRDLTQNNTAVRTIMIDGSEYKMEMSNQKLIHISAELFRRMSDVIKRVMKDSESEWEDIDKIILVGGSSKMPVVKKYIESICDTMIVLDDSPDESVAYGVGIAAAIKMRKGDVKDTVLADICPFSLGVEMLGGIFSPIIERNEILPCSRSSYYVTVNDFQSCLQFDIYQGENMIAKENLLLCTMEIKNLPKVPKGMTGALVTFMYDINGILDIKIEGEKQSLHKTIVNQNMKLSNVELKKKLQELKEMTLHPSEYEENRLLLEEAKRLYRECNPKYRNLILEQYNLFEEILDTHDNREIREAYVRFAVFLQAIEKNKFDFNVFEESFWTEEDE